jgi:hypothetical protein
MSFRLNFLSQSDVRPEASSFHVRLWRSTALRGPVPIEAGIHETQMLLSLKITTIMPSRLCNVEHFFQ